MTNQTIKIREVEFPMDAFLKNALDNIKKRVTKQDWNSILVIVGRPGSGKSVIGHQIASVLDNKYNMDKCIFNPPELLEVSINMQKGEAVVYDEAYSGLSSRKAMSKQTQNILQYFNEMRQQNGFLILNIPDFHALDKQVVKQVDAVIEVFTHKGKRGFYRFYDNRRGRLKQWRENFKKKPKHNFIGKFPKHYGLIDEEKYKVKKRQSLMDFLLGTKKQEKEQKFAAALHIIREQWKTPYETLSLKFKEHGINIKVNAMEKAVSRFRKDNGIEVFEMPD